MKDKRKHHGAVDKRSLEQQFCKSIAVTFLCNKTGAVALVQPGLTAGRLADSPANEMLLHLEPLKLYSG